MPVLVQDLKEECGSKGILLLGYHIPAKAESLKCFKSGFATREGPSEPLEAFETHGCLGPPAHMAVRL